MNLFVGAFFNAGILGLGLVIFATLFGKLHPLIDIFAHFLLPAIVAALVMALLAAFAGRATTMLIYVGLAVVCTALVWPWVQQPAKVATTGPHFTLMAFNVYYHNRQLERVAALVRETKPDIVVLLEVVPRVRPALDPVADLYPYRVECWQEQWCDALVLSRLPLTDIRATLPEAKFRRPMGAVEVTIEGRKLTLFPTHLSLPYPLNGRDAQTGEIKEVVETIAGVPSPRLLVGDFNASPWATTMALPQKQLNMTLLTGGDGSWPTFLPRAMGIPIDHILATPELALQSRKLFAVSGSDHRAVLAEIAFKE
jgi:endonuclease/exonuclease/phosphatase (EEP) superfamily protein YafD